MRRLAGMIPVLLVCLSLVAAHASETGDAKPVRLAVVNTPQFSGLLDSLLPDFERETGIEVEVYSGSDVYRKGWFIDYGHVKAAAILAAEEKKGYVIRGAFPFLRFDNARESSELEILVAEDPSLQRIMAAVVVSPDKVPGVNADGAQALVDYLLSPRIQAKIAAFRTPGSDLQLWWPAGRNN